LRDAGLEESSDPKLTASSYAGQILQDQEIGTQQNRDARFSVGGNLESGAVGRGRAVNEMLTVHRLNCGEPLRRTLSSTNAIESCPSTVERVTRSWRGGDQAQRWTATGLLEAEKKFRPVNGYREPEGLHRRMNPLSLTQQEWVA
jgi:hypothetical protein